MPHTTLDQETRWAYSRTLPSPHGATFAGHTIIIRWICCSRIQASL